jgi:SAM-dependent methyltransferase
MNPAHLELCSSAEWAEAVEQWVIPHALDGIELGDDVVEVGPGPGLTTDVLRRQVAHLTAVEIDPDLAGALTQRMADTNVEVVEADATDMPFPDDRFSGAISLTMLHHVPSIELQDRLFAEVRRVLQPGAWFAGSDSIDTPDWRELHEGDVCVPLDPTTLADRFTAAGFVDVTVDLNDYAVRFRGAAPPR